MSWRSSLSFMAVAAQSGRPDSNWRPPAPKAGALTKLRHAPRLPYLTDPAVAAAVSGVRGGRCTPRSTVFGTGSPSPAGAGVREPRCPGPVGSAGHMRSSAEVLEGNRVKLSVEVDEGELEDAMRETLRRLQRE